MGYLIDKLRRMRLVIGGAVVMAFALGAGGDVAGRADAGIASSPPVRDVADGGFLYGDWIARRRVADDDSDGYTGGDSGFSAPASFWRDNAARIGGDVKLRLRAALLSALPDAAEVRDIMLRYGNGGEVDAGEWGRSRQLRLQDSLRDVPFAVVADSERRFADELGLAAQRRLAFVRRARVEFQTPLGGRAGQLGVDAAGALRAADDDVIGWQLRAYGGEGKAAGGNAGLFWRFAGDNDLLGANLFADYEEDNEDGGFWRWSLGAEWQSRYGGVSANRYFALTDGKRRGDGRIAYTREGFDIDGAVRVPGAEWLSATFGYYNWRGEYGDGDDDGLHYGFRAEPGGGLELAIRYDADSGDVGGELSYSRILGEAAPSARSFATFDPRGHFFDAVRREYGQRISRSAARFSQSPSMMVRVQSAPVVVNIAADSYGAAVLGSGLSLTASVRMPGVGVVMHSVDYAFPLAMPGGVRLTTGDGGGQTLSAAMLLESEQWFMTLAQNSSVEFLGNGATLSIGGGRGVLRVNADAPMSVMLINGAAVSLFGARLAFDADAGRVYVFGGSVAVSSPGVSVVRVLPLAVTILPVSLLTRVGGSAGVSLFAARGGVLPYRYALLSSSSVVASMHAESGVLSYAPPPQPQTLTIIAAAADSTGATATATAQLAITNPPPMEVVARFSSTAMPVEEFVLMHWASVSGGYVAEGGEYRLSMAGDIGQGGGGNREINISITAEDDHINTPPATLILTISITSGTVILPRLSANAVYAIKSANTPPPEVAFAKVIPLSLEIKMAPVYVGHTGPIITLVGVGGQFNSGDGQVRPYRYQIEGDVENLYTFSSRKGYLIGIWEPMRTPGSINITAIISDLNSTVRVPLTISVVWRPITLSVLHHRPLIAKNGEQIVAIVTVSSDRRASLASVQLLGGGANKRVSHDGGTISVNAGGVTGVITVVVIADDEKPSSAPVKISVLVTVYDRYVLTAGAAWNNVITMITGEPVSAPRDLAEIAADGSTPLSFNFFNKPPYLRLASDAGKLRLQLISSLPQNPTVVIMTIWVEERKKQLPQQLFLFLTLTVAHPPPLTMSVLEPPPAYLISDRGKGIGGIYAGSGGWLADGGTDYHFSVQWHALYSDLLPPRNATAHIVNGTVFTEVWLGYPVDMTVIMDDDHFHTPPVTKSFRIKYQWPMHFGYANPHNPVFDETVHLYHLSITTDAEHPNLGVLWTHQAWEENFEATLINSRGYMAVELTLYDRSVRRFLAHLHQHTVITDPPGVYIVTALLKDKLPGLRQTGTVLLTVDVRAPPVGAVAVNQPSSALRGVMSSVGVVSVVRGYEGGGFSFGGAAVGAAGAQVSVNDEGVIWLRSPPQRNGMVTVVAHADDDYSYTPAGSVSLTVSITDPPVSVVLMPPGVNNFAVPIDNIKMTLTGYAGWLSPSGMLSVGGGRLGSMVSLSVAVAGAASIGFDGLTILISAGSGGGLLTATIVGDDDADHTAPGTLIITITVAPPNTDMRVSGFLTAGITTTVTLGHYAPRGGFLPYRYSLAVARDDIVFAAPGDGKSAAVVFRGSAHAPGILTATAIVEDSRAQRAEMLLLAGFVRAPSLSIFAVSVNGLMETGGKNWAASLSASGGYGAHVFFLPEAREGFAVEDSVLLVSSSSPITASATIAVDDENDYTYRHLTVMAVTVLHPVSIIPPPLILLKTRAPLTINNSFATLSAVGGHPGGDGGYVFGITGGGGYAGLDNNNAGSVLLWQTNEVGHTPRTVTLTLYADDNSQPRRRGSVLMSLLLAHPTVSLGVRRLLSVVATGVVATAAAGVFADGSGGGYSMTVIGAGGASLSARVDSLSMLVVRGASLGIGTITLAGTDNHPDSTPATAVFVLRLSSLLRLPPPLDKPVTVTSGRAEVLTTLRATNTIGAPVFSLIDAPPVVSAAAESGVLSFLSLTHLPTTITLTAAAQDYAHSLADLRAAATALLTMEVVPPPMSILFVPPPEIITGTVTTGLLTITGGYVSVAGGYAYSAAGDNVSVNAEGEVIVMTDAPTTLTATLFVDDDHYHTPRASLLFTIAAPDRLTLLPAGIFMTTGMAMTSRLLSLQVHVGSPPYRYALADALPPYIRFDISTGIFDLVGKPPDAPQSFSLVVTVADGSAVQRKTAATIAVVIGHPPPLSYSFGGDVIVRAGEDAANIVFSVYGGALSVGSDYGITARALYGATITDINGNNVRLEAFGRLGLYSVTAIFIADDDHRQTTPITATLTLAAEPGFYLSPLLPTVTAFAGLSLSVSLDVATILALGHGADFAAGDELVFDWYDEFLQDDEDMDFLRLDDDGTDNNYAVIRQFGHADQPPGTITAMFWIEQYNDGDFVDEYEATVVIHYVDKPLPPVSGTIYYAEVQATASVAGATVLATIVGMGARDYDYSLLGGDGYLHLINGDSGDGIVSLAGAPSGLTARAGIVIADRLIPSRERATLSLSLIFLPPPLSLRLLPPDAASVIVSASPPRAHLTMQAFGGIGGYVYSALSLPDGFALSGAVLWQTAVLQTAATLTLTLQAADNASPPYSAFALWTLYAHPLLPLSAGIGLSGDVATHGEVAATIRGIGGVPPYRYGGINNNALVDSESGAVRLFAALSGTAQITAAILINDDNPYSGAATVILTADVFRPRSPLPGVFFGNGEVVKSAVTVIRHIGGLSVSLSGVNGLTGRVMPPGIFGVSAFVRGGGFYALRMHSALTSHGMFLVTLVGGDAGGVYDPVSAVFTITASEPAGEVIFIGGGNPHYSFDGGNVLAAPADDLDRWTVRAHSRDLRWVGQRAALLNGTIVIAGGSFRHNGHPFNDIVLSPDKGHTWERYSPPNFRLSAGFGMAAHNGALYVVNGKYAWRSIDARHWTPLTTRGLSVVANLPLLSHRGSLVMPVVGIGGEYRGAWTSADGMNWTPPHRGHYGGSVADIAAVSHQGRVYLYWRGNAGYFGDDAGRFTKCGSYAYLSNGMRGVSFGGSVYLTGGNDHHIRASEGCGEAIAQGGIPRGRKQGFVMMHLPYNTHRINPPTLPSSLAAVFASPLTLTAGVLLTAQTAAKASIGGGRPPYLYNFASAAPSYLRVNNRGIVVIRGGPSAPDAGTILTLSVRVRNAGLYSPPVIAPLTVNIIAPSALSAQVHSAEGLQSFGKVAGTVRAIGGVLPYAYSGDIVNANGEYVFVNRPAGFASGDILSATIIVSDASSSSVSVVVSARTGLPLPGRFIGINHYAPVKSPFDIVGRFRTTLTTGALAASVSPDDVFSVAIVNRGGRFRARVYSSLTVRGLFTAVMSVGDADGNYLPRTATFYARVRDIPPPPGGGIFINSIPPAPLSLSFGINAPLTIAAETMPGVLLTANAVGGFSPIVFNLQPSLFLRVNDKGVIDAAISPVSAGTFVITAIATDDARAPSSALAAFTIIVADAPGNVRGIDMFVAAQTASALITRKPALAASVSIVGGYAPDGVYALSASAPGGSAWITGNALLLSMSVAGLITATITGDDIYTGTPPVTAFLTMRVYDDLTAAVIPPVRTVILFDAVPRALATISAFGGGGGYVYSLSIPDNAPPGFVFGGNVVSLTATMSLTATVIMTAFVEDAPFAAAAVMTILAESPKPLGASVRYLGGLLPAGDIGGTIIATGGLGVYRFTAMANVSVHNTSGEFRMLAPPGFVPGGLLSATVLYTDDDFGLFPLKVFLTARVGEYLPLVWHRQPGNARINELHHLGGFRMTAALSSSLSWNISPPSHFTATFSGSRKDGGALFVQSALKAEGVWTATAAAFAGGYIPSTAYFTARAATPDGEVFIIGGRDSEGVGNEVVYAAAPDNLGAWTPVATIGIIGAPRVANVNGTIVVAGELQVNGGSHRRVLWSADRGRTWASYEQPFREFESFDIAAHNGAVYVIGHLRGEASPTWRSYDIAAGPAGWHRVEGGSQLPEALYVKAVSYRGSLIVVGADYFSDSGGVYVFEEGAPWRKVSDGEFGQISGLAMQYGGKLYKYSYDSNARVWEYGGGDIDSDWRLCHPGKRASYGEDVLPINGTVYLFDIAVPPGHGCLPEVSAVTLLPPAIRDSRHGYSHRALYLPRVIAPDVPVIKPPSPLRASFSGGVRMTSGGRVTASLTAMQVYGGRTPYRYSVVGDASGYLSVNDGIVSVVGGAPLASVAATAEVLVAVRDSYVINGRATATLTITLIPPSPLSASVFVSGGGGLVRASALVGNITATGLPPLRFSSSSPFLTLRGNLFGFLPSVSGADITATIIADDDGYQPPVTMVVSARAGVQISVSLATRYATIYTGSGSPITDVRTKPGFVGELTAAISHPDVYLAGSRLSRWRIVSRLTTGGLRTMGITIGDAGGRYFPFSAQLTVWANNYRGEVILIGGSVVYAAHDKMRAWHPRATVEGLALHGHRVLDLNGTIVVVGGRKKSDGGYSKLIWHSADRGRTWQSNRSMDDGGGEVLLFRHAALAHENAVYALGGYRNGQKSSRIYRLDNPSGRWRRVIHNGAFPAAADFGAVSYGGAILVPMPVPRGRGFISYSGGRYWSEYPSFDWLAISVGAHEAVFNTTSGRVQVMETSAGGGVATFTPELAGIHACRHLFTAAQPDAQALSFDDAVYLIGGGMRAVRDLTSGCHLSSHSGLLPSDDIAVSVRAVFLPYEPDYIPTIAPPPQQLGGLVAPSGNISLVAHSLTLTMATVRALQGMPPYRYSLVNAPPLFVVHPHDGIVSFTGSIAAGTMTLTVQIRDDHWRNENARAHITIITSPLADVSLGVRYFNNLNLAARQPLRTMAILNPSGGYARGGYVMRASLESAGVATVIGNEVLVSAAAAGQSNVWVVADDIDGLTASRAAVHRFVVNVVSPLFVRLSVVHSMTAFYDAAVFGPGQMAAVRYGGGYSQFTFGRPQLSVEEELDNFALTGADGNIKLRLRASLTASSDVLVTVLAEDDLQPPSQSRAVLTLKRIAPISASVAVDSLLLAGEGRATIHTFGGVPPYQYTAGSGAVIDAGGIARITELRHGRITIGVVIDDASALSPPLTTAITANTGGRVANNFNGAGAYSVVVGIPHLIGDYRMEYIGEMSLTFGITPDNIIRIRRYPPRVVDVSPSGGGGITLLSVSADFYAAPQRYGIYTITIKAGYAGGRHLPARAVWTIKAARAGGAVLLVGGDDGIVWSAAEDNIGQWSPLATVAGLARKHHRVVTHNGTIMVVGGEGEKGRRIYRSADKGRTWADYESPFGARHKFGMASFRGDVYVAGGYDETGRRLNDVWRSEDGRNWQQLAARGLPSGGIADNALINYNGTLVIPGGDNGGNASQNRRIYRSIDGVVWSGNNPSHRDGTRGYAAAVHNGSLFIHGIRGESGGVWYGDGSLTRWHRCGIGRGRNITPGATDASALSFGGSLYLFGGGALTIRRTSGCPPQADDGGNIPPGKEYAQAIHITRAAVEDNAPLPQNVGIGIIPPGIATLTADSVATVIIGTVAAFGGMPPYRYAVSGGSNSFVSVNAGSGILYQYGTASSVSPQTITATDYSYRRDIVVLSLSMVIVPPSPLSAEVLITSGVVGVSVIAATIRAFGGAVPYRFSPLGGNSDINASLGYVRYHADIIGGGSIATRAFAVRDAAGAVYTAFVTATVLHELPGRLVPATAGIIPVGFGKQSRVGEFYATLAAGLSLTAGITPPGQFGVSIIAKGGGRYAAYIRSAITSGGRQTAFLIVGDSGGGYLPYRAALTTESAKGEVVIVGYDGDVWAAQGNNLTDWQHRGYLPGNGGGLMANLNGTLVVAATENNYLTGISYSADRGRTWKRVENIFPPRQGYGMATHNGAVYVVGGRSKGGYYLRDVWRSTTIAEWQRISAPGLDAVADFPLISHKGSLIIPGGRQEYGDANSRRVYSASGRFWRRQVPGGDAPGGGLYANHAAAVYRDNVYIYHLGDVYAFDDADNWRSCGQSLPYRAGARALVFNDAVYMFGGGGAGDIIRIQGCPPAITIGQTPARTEYSPPVAYLPFDAPGFIPPPPPLLDVSVNIHSPLTITAGALATVNLLTAHAFDGAPPFAYSVNAGYLTVINGVVILVGEPPQTTTTTINIRVTDNDLLPSTVDVFFTLAAVAPPPLRLDILPPLLSVIVGGEGERYLPVSVSGGFVKQGGVYRINTGGGVLITAAEGSIAQIPIVAAIHQHGQMTVELIADDDHRGTLPARALITIQVIAPLQLQFTPPSVSVVATLSTLRAIARLSASGGRGLRQYSLINAPRGFALDGIAVHQTQKLLNPSTLTLTAAAADSNTPPRMATARMEVAITPLQQFAARLSIADGIIAANSPAAAKVDISGGLPPYRYATDNRLMNINRSGDIWFHLQPGGAGKITAAITVNDSYESAETPPVSLTLTAFVAPRLRADADGNESTRNIRANKWTAIGTLEISRDYDDAVLTAFYAPFVLAGGEYLGLDDDGDRQMRILAGPTRAGLYTLSAIIADNGGSYAPSSPFVWTITAEASPDVITLKPPIRGEFRPQRVITLTAQLDLRMPLATFAIEGGLSPVAFSVFGYVPNHTNFITTRRPDWLAVGNDGIISVNGVVKRPLTLDRKGGAGMVAVAADALGQTVSTTFTLMVISKTNLSATLHKITPLIGTGRYANVASIAIGGGHLSGGDYNLRVNGGGASATYKINGRMVRVAARQTGMLTATIIADDEGNNNTPPVTMLLTLTVVPQLKLSVEKETITIIIPPSITTGTPLLTASASGGIPPYQYRLDWPPKTYNPLSIGAGGIIALRNLPRYEDSQRAASRYWNLKVRDGGGGGYLRATKRQLRLIYQAADVVINKSQLVNAPLATGKGWTMAAQLSASGGYLRDNNDNYVYVIATTQGASLSASVDSGGGLSVYAISAGVATIIVVADDNHSASKPATARITLTMINAADFAASIVGIRHSVLTSPLPTRVATLSIGGGYVPDGETYNLRGEASQGAITFGGRQSFGYAVSLLAQEAGAITATIIASDKAPSTTPATMQITTQAIQGASIIKRGDLTDGLVIITAARRARWTGTLVATNGFSGDDNDGYTFSLLVTNRNNAPLLTPRRGRDTGFFVRKNMLIMRTGNLRTAASHTMTIRISDDKSNNQPADLRTTITFVFTLSVIANNASAPPPPANFPAMPTMPTMPTISFLPPPPITAPPRRRFVPLI